jgi:hypothetical protein
MPRLVKRMAQCWIISQSQIATKPEQRGVMGFIHA